MDPLAELNARLVSCRRCARLVAWREQVAAERRAAFAREEYWGRPVPGFGDPAARLLVVGLAPAAHGANRTGRMFTGDRSGDWLYRALHRAGFADRAGSRGRDDGLRLTDAYITAPVRCPPPANRPTAAERANCRTWLEEEYHLLDSVQVIVCLGAVAYEEVLRLLGAAEVPTPQPRRRFAHELVVETGGPVLLCSYHPSQQNTFTGRLTEQMLDAVFTAARARLQPSARAGAGNRVRPSPGGPPLLPLNEQTFERVAASLPAWARPSADQGFAAFTSLPMPDPRQEEWRYAEVGVDLDSLLLPTAAGEPLPPEGSLAPALGELAGYAANVDGRTASVRAGDGIGLSALVGALAAGGEAVRRAFRSGPGADIDRFAAAHHAFAADGVFLHVARGQRLPRPVLVEFQATAAGSLALPRLTVLAEEGAEASVVLHQRSPDGVALVAVPQVEVVAAENAHVLLTIVQEWGDATRAFGHQTMAVGRDSSLTFSEAGLGGSSARLHLRIGLDGAGSEARVFGVYFGHRHQTLDYRYYVAHRAQHTTSSMYLKGAVGDTARSVFTGLIRIEPEGQYSDALQTNRNLVLSEGAQAHSVPNLEILANEVRCGHGSAVGPLDPEQRYYLMSRGLDEARADRLQVKGFFEDVLARFPHGELEPSLRGALLARYDGLESREG